MRENFFNLNDYENLSVNCLHFEYKRHNPLVWIVHNMMVYKLQLLLDIKYFNFSI